MRALAPATEFEGDAIGTVVDSDSSSPNGRNGWRAIALCGSGGTAEVWHAVAPDGREAALKRLKPELRQSAQACDRLRREYALLQRVASPHLVRPLELVERDADPELALEFLPHGDLVSLLGAPVRHWLPAMRGVVAALADLHEHGAAHGDVKARNVMFAADHGARLIDLTSARAVDAPAVRATAAYSVPAGVGSDGRGRRLLRVGRAALRAHDGAVAIRRERARSAATSFAPSERPTDPAAARLLAAATAMLEAGGGLPEGLSHFADVIESVSALVRLSNNSVDSSHPQHDETIVPLRPGFRTGAEQPDPAMSAAPRGPRNWPLLLIGTALVIGVVVAFVWLPSRVEEERAAPPQTAAAPSVAEPARPVLSAEEQAALKKQAEDLLAGLLTLQDRLTSLNAEKWASEDWQRYQALSEAGDNEFLANDFAAAVASYSDATSLGDAIIARAAADVERSFNAGEAALYAGNAELAIEQYDLVLTIEPAHAAALAQRARAERLPEVLAIVQRADSERERGELTTALASYREALAIDAGWALATDGVNDVSRALRDAEFERLLVRRVQHARRGELHGGARTFPRGSRRSTRFA